MNTRVVIFITIVSAMFTLGYWSAWKFAPSHLDLIMAGFFALLTLECFMGLCMAHASNRAGRAPPPGSVVKVTLWGLAFFFGMVGLTIAHFTNYSFRASDFHIAFGGGILGFIASLGHNFRILDRSSF